MLRFRIRWLAIVLLLVPGVAGAQDNRVVVLPFEVYNAPDLDPLRPGLEAMLAGRLDGPGYTVVQGAEPQPSDWTVRTTITRLGSTYSVDGALVPPAESPAEGARSYRTVGATEEILPALEALAQELKAYLTQTLPAQPPATPAPSPALREEPAPATPASGPTPPASGVQAAVASPRVGPLVDGNALGLTAADLDGDGITEIVVLGNQVLTAYRDTGTRFERLWEVPVPPGITPACISAADLDGNGRPELFVAGMSGTQPTSQALEWFGSALASKGERIPGFARAADPSAPVVLLAPRGTGKDLFSGRLLTLRWGGAGYVAGDPLPLPGAALPANADRVHLNPTAFGWAVTTQGDRLRLYDDQGSEIFESADAVKGSRVALQGEERIRDYQDEDFYRVHGRTLSRLSQGSTPEFVLFKNYGGISRVFRRIASFSYAQLLVWKWDGLTMVPVAEGPKVPGALVDLDWDPASPGRRVYALLVRSEGTLFRKDRHRILVYEFR